MSKFVVVRETLIFKTMDTFNLKNKGCCELDALLNKTKEDENILKYLFHKLNLK